MQINEIYYELFLTQTVNAVPVGKIDKKIRDMPWLLKRHAMAFEKGHAMACPFKSYCTNGMARGYLNSSPLEALMLAMMIQIIFSVTSMNMMGKPIMIIQSGATSIM